MSSTLSFFVFNGVFSNSVEEITSYALGRSYVKLQYYLTTINCLPYFKVNMLILYWYVASAPSVRRNPPEKSFTCWFIQPAFIGTSRVVQWIRVHLPMQGTQVRSLVWEDPTCLKQLSPSTPTTEPALWSPCSAREASTVKSPHTATGGSPRSLQPEKACVHNYKYK